MDKNTEGRNTQPASSPIAEPDTATQAAKPLTDEQIDTLWNSLDGKALILNENQLNWNKVIRVAFARAIELHLKGGSNG